MLDKFELKRCGKPIFPDGEADMTRFVLDGWMIHWCQPLIDFDMSKRQHRKAIASG